RVGQRAGAAVPVPGLARLHAPLGAARRPGVGTCARVLSLALRDLVRRAGPAPRAPARARGGGAMNGAVGKVGSETARAAARLPGRVLMTTDAVGGVWTYALALSRALGRAGVAVDLAVTGPPPGAGQRRAAAAIASVELHVCPNAPRLEWMDEPWR